ncbi:hypothetical protein BJX99DRAFT_255558 [Aspergillus californicus]
MLLARHTAIRTSAIPRGNYTQKAGRRTYATTHEVKKNSDWPWALLSAGVSIPVFYYLYQAGSKKPEHNEHKGAEH